MNAKSKAKTDAWTQIKATQQSLLDGYKTWQRRAISMPIIHDQAIHDAMEDLP